MRERITEGNTNKSGIFGSSLRMLYSDAEQENKNIAWALDVASNYLFYRECLGILTRHGIGRGLAILFDALKFAERKGLAKARQRMMHHLPSEVKKEINEESALAGRLLTVRSPFAPDCITEDIELDG